MPVVPGPACARLAAGLGLAVAMCALSASARAEEAPAEYKKTVVAALAEYDAGNFLEARALFERAHAIKPSARTHRGLGIVAFELKRYVSARTHFQAALRDRVLPLSETQREKVEQLLYRTEAFVGRFAVVLEPAHAELSVDGDEGRYDESGELLLNVGRHELRASLSGYRAIDREVDVKGGEREELRLSLDPALGPGVGPTAAAGAAGHPSAREPTDPDDEGGLLSSPWFWVAVGVVSIGGGVALAFALGGGTEEPYGGNAGVVLEAP